jgi:hypothetical protein
MQYLLTEAEYLELKLEQSERLMLGRDKLQSICTLAAQHIPVPHEWSVDITPRPWGCILADPSPGYCDDCPTILICPHKSKRWSK